jgi:hypothetical protein
MVKKKKAVEEKISNRPECFAWQRFDVHSLNGSSHVKNVPLLPLWIWRFGNFFGTCVIF